MAWPLPQPTSATSMPSRNRSASPGTSGTTASRRAASSAFAVSSAMTSWIVPKAAYGTPPPWRKHSTSCGSTPASNGMYCMPTDALAAPADRPSETACSGGRWYLRVAGS